MAENIRVVVVDDHALLRRGVIRALELDDMIKVVGEGASAADAIKLAGLHAPDLIMLDISMPGSGIEAARVIHNLPIPTRIVMLTVSGDEDDVMNAFEAGAVGYLLKGTDANDLIAAVKSVGAGESFISPNLAIRILSSMAQAEGSSLTSLSEYEKRTLCLISEGLTNREVGEQLAVPEKTVRHNVINIFRKLKVKNSAEATVVAKQSWNELQSRTKLH